MTLEIKTHQISESMYSKAKSKGLCLQWFTSSCWQITLAFSITYPLIAIRMSLTKQLAKQTINKQTISKQQQNHIHLYSTAYKNSSHRRGEILRFLTKNFLIHSSSQITDFSQMAYSIKKRRNLHTVYHLSTKCAMWQ